MAVDAREDCRGGCEFPAVDGEGEPHEVEIVFLDGVARRFV